MLSAIKRFVILVFGLVGLELHYKRNSPVNLLNQALRHFDIDTVLDVGANAGQFAKELRRAGFNGRIISFEPLTDAHRKLTRAAKRDPNWIVHERSALGDQIGETTINVSGNSVSSSILGMSESHSDVRKISAYTGSEKITLTTLDAIADQYLSAHNKTFLKIDTQGFEPQVLDGAAKTLPSIEGVLLETSLIELYTDQILWRDLIDRMENEGFTIWSLERGFFDPRNGRTLQCDAVFFREKNSG